MFKSTFFVLLCSLIITACTLSQQQQSDSTVSIDYTPNATSSTATSSTPINSPTTIPSPSPTTLVVIPPISPTPEPNQIDLSIEEHSIVNSFIEVVKLEDTRLLYDYIQNNSMNIAERQDNDHSFYSTFFEYLLVDLNHDLSNLSFTVESFNKLEHDYRYTIMNTALNKPIGLVADVYEKEFYWGYLYYIPYTKRMVSNYLSYIQHEDIDKLTSIMTVDDLQYEKSKSELIINNYKQYFGKLDNLHFEYSGDFNFTIYNDDNKSHTINIVYGDGLMGIVDSFAPDPHD